jgi:hypothetical protein
MRLFRVSMREVPVVTANEKGNMGRDGTGRGSCQVMRHVRALRTMKTPNIDDAGRYMLSTIAQISKPSSFSWKFDVKDGQ